MYIGHGGPEEVAGVVEAIGDGVTGFAVGDAVFGNTDTGGFSEYALLPVSVTAHKPGALSFTDAATLPVATASAGKKAFVESLGVTHVEYGPGVADRIRAAAPRGIDAIYDQVGGAALEEVAPLLTDRSKLVSAGDRATTARLGGTFVARARNQEVLDAVAQLVVRGALNPFVTSTFPLDQAAQALRLVEDGHAQGKVVIGVAP